MNTVFEYRPKICKWFIISILFQLPLWKLREMISFKLYHQHVCDKLRGLNIETHHLKAGHSYNIMFYGQLVWRFLQSLFSACWYFANHPIFIQTTAVTTYIRLLNKYIRSTNKYITRIYITLKNSIENTITSISVESHWIFSYWK